MPYMTKVHALPVLKPGSKVQLAVQKIDTLLMELECRFVRVVEETVTDETAAEETVADTLMLDTGDTAAGVVENA
jgi:exoribonuclease II